MSGKSKASADARAASFNPSHNAFNPTSKNSGSSMAAKGQGSMDARANAYNPQSKSFNPSSKK
jgi:hypothetical protein